MCENEKKKYHSIEMTTGSLWKNILLFSLPLMGSQVLEVLFNGNNAFTAMVRPMRSSRMM